MESIVIVLLGSLVILSIIGALFASVWDEHKRAVARLQQAESLLWRVAQSERQYSPSACYVRMRDGLEDQIDDFIGFDEMGQ